MKAMIFAAGLGTRLKPLTDSMPKALVPVAGKPLLEHVINKLKKSGFDEILINIHHFPDQIIDFVKDNKSFGIRIEFSDERECLLDTGGGIRKASEFFNDGKPFLVHNVDILSNIDLEALYRFHLDKNPLATLVVSERKTSRYLLFDDNQNLRGWTNVSTGEYKPKGIENADLYKQYAFSGIQVLSHSVFDLMENYRPKFPIIDFYLDHVNGHEIRGYIPEKYLMLDVGKIDILNDAEVFSRLIQ